MGNIVAIIGRPNVGKSTLFNRLIGERQAIVDDLSGVTRDRLYGSCVWNGKTFTVIDTGGFVPESEDVFEAAIRSQVRIAIEEASVLVFMVDVTTGVTDLDEAMAVMLRRSTKPVFLVVNKVDNGQRMMEANEFWSLGIENTFFLSSMTGSGTGELLDAIAEQVVDEEPRDVTLPRIAILGRPNVGKSSLINALLGEERNIVTDIAGTTRDSIDSHYNKFGKEFLLVDTAGIRKKSRVHEDLEFYSVMRAIKALEDCDICVLMIDAQAGIEAQDMAIFRLAQRRHKGIVILVNKWDLVSKETNTARDMEKTIKEKISPFDDVPIVFISTLEKQRIFKAVEAAMEVYENRNRKLKTSELNEVMQEIIERNPPPAYRGNYIKIKYITQLSGAHPVIAFFCNHPKQIQENYRNFLENQLRKHFKFTGVPVSILFRQK
jgi:GTP-binding protein